MSFPSYPIYVPTKGRHQARNALTVRFLMEDEIPFRAVVEEEEHDLYAAVVGEERLLVLPESGQGLIFARNWIKEHSISEGHERHWQLDDNIRSIQRFHKGRRIKCRGSLGLRTCEVLTDRYENVAISGLNYVMFGVGKQPPFYLNVHVYSCTLVNNVIPHRWRLRYNDDTDMCLQVLADGWCTILVNAFLAEKIWTGKHDGGNTDDLYQGDGRLVMARSLERKWPGVVTTDRRFQRPQHVVNSSWRKFDTPLKLKPCVDLESMQSTDELGMTLNALKETKSPELQQFADEFREQHG